MTVADRGSSTLLIFSIDTGSKGRTVIFLLTQASQATDEHTVHCGQNQSALLSTTVISPMGGSAREPNQGNQNPSRNFPTGELKQSRKGFFPN